jgi:hypothetical protein
VNLKKLICRENRLKDCWDLANSKLEELDLQKNQISDDTKMQKTMTSLSHIKKLNIKDNCFIEEIRLNSIILETCTSLEELNEENISQMRNPNESKEI